MSIWQRRHNHIVPKWSGVIPSWGIGCLVLAIISATNLSIANRPTDRPNVVLLLADDLGSRDIGCDGGPVKTPALDRLAKGGVRFTNFYSGAPVCSPARATLLTGRHHLRTGVYTVIQDHIHHMHLLRNEVTIAEILKANGYQTVHLGKWHLGAPFRGMQKPWIDEHGFDYWFATDLNAAPSHRNPNNFWRNRKRVGQLNGYACQIVVDEAIDWLDQKCDPNKPFFLNVWFHEPHAPLAAPENLVSRYGSLDDPAAIYSATIDNTDRAIDRLLKKLEGIGALENTIVIYTSDHGSYRPERNGSLRGQKGSLLEGGIRTPGIFSWPKRIRGGRVEDTPAGAIDLLPTICSLAGIENDNDGKLDGVDLAPLLLGESSDFNRTNPLTWHSPTSQPAIAMRDGQYVLVGWRKSEYPKDLEAIRSVMDEMRVILEKKMGRELTPAELWHACYNSPIGAPWWNQLRSRFVTLNTFQEAWIPTIKSGSGGISRFELYDLTADAGQTTNIAARLPGVFERMKQSALSINASVLEEAPLWNPKAPTVSATKENRHESKGFVHQLESQKRSPLDAFLYVNRIPVDPEPGETQEELAGRILGRLANQEGRVLIKLPLGMNRLAYRGFKLAIGSESAQGFRHHCIACHHLPELGQPSATPAITSLRNGTQSRDQLRRLLNDAVHKDIDVSDDEIGNLHAFMRTLVDVPDERFRELILKATVLDTTGNIE